VDHVFLITGFAKNIAGLLGVKLFERGAPLQVAGAGRGMG